VTAAVVVPRACATAVFLTGFLSIAFWLAVRCVIALFAARAARFFLREAKDGDFGAIFGAGDSTVIWAEVPRASFASLRGFRGTAGGMIKGIAFFASVATEDLAFPICLETV
jgi:hypothetical protein